MFNKKLVCQHFGYKSGVISNNYLQSKRKPVIYRLYCPKSARRFEDCMARDRYEFKLINRGKIHIFLKCLKNLEPKCWFIKRYKNK